MILGLGAETVRAQTDEQTDALRWLERLSDSADSLDYHGIFVYGHGGKMQSLRITHAVIDGRELEHLEYLDGTERRFVRDGDSLRYVHPKNSLERFYRRGDALQGPASVADSYDVRAGGSERVAGREGILLSVLPQDRWRFGYRMVLDRDTGLLLRSETIASNNLVLERFQFVDIMVGDLPAEVIDRLVVAEAGGQSLAPRDLRRRDIADRPWQVGWTPPGFVAAPAVSHGPGQGDAVTFADGLAAFSVFVEPGEAGDDARGEGMARHGATIAYTRVLEDRLITVVGEVPRHTAEKVARSLSWKSDH